MAQSFTSFACFLQSGKTEKPPDLSQLDVQQPRELQHGCPPTWVPPQQLPAPSLLSQRDSHAAVSVTHAEVKCLFPATL